MPRRERHRVAGTVVAGSREEGPAKLLRALETENATLRDTVAELALKTAILREQLEGRIPDTYLGAGVGAGRAVRRVLSVLAP